MSINKFKLNKTIRRIIMSMLILSFFVISPIIILYTAGYRYDFETRQIKKTGVISIDVDPKNVEVYLNDIKIKKNIPIRLSDITPGTYNLKIKKDGYKNWEKDITVISKQTTYIKNISLFKDSSPTILSGIDTEGIVKINSSPDGKFILIIKKEAEIYEIKILNTENLNLESIMRKALESKPEISWSPFNNFFITKTK